MKLDTIPQAESYIKTKANRNALVQHVKDCMRIFYQKNEIRDRYESIDRAYMMAVTRMQDECGPRRGDSVSDIDNLAIPVLLSQSDAAVGALSSVFLPRYPLFPVIGDEEIDKGTIGDIEALIEEHSIKGKWRKQFIRLFKQFSRYNDGAIEMSWEPIYDAEAVQDAEVLGDREFPLTYINSLKTPNIYNRFYDIRTEPGMASIDGEFAGYQEFISKPELISRLTRRHLEKKLYSNDPNMFDTTSKFDTQLYWKLPLINEKVSFTTSTNWLEYTGVHLGNKTPDRPLYSWVRAYVRIDPDDFGAESTALNIQTIMVEIVNHKWLVYAEPVITYFNMLPLLIGQYNEDDMGLQTKSPSENVLSIQEAATDLLNDRRAATKRAVADRMLYDPAFLDSKHMDSRNPSARIPLKKSIASIGGDVDFRKIIYPFPWTDSTEGVIMQDLGFLLGLPEFATGLNSAKEGRFRKGNRTAAEFNEIMGNMDDRQIPSFLCMEANIFSPIKHQIRFNLARFLEQDVDFVSSPLKKKVSLSAAEVKQAMSKIKLADGLMPREQVANVQVLTAMFDAITKIPQLSQRMDIFKFFVYIASMSGMHNVEKFELGQSNTPIDQSGGLSVIQGGEGATAPPTPQSDITAVSGA